MYIFHQILIGEVVLKRSKNVSMKNYQMVSLNHHQITPLPCLLNPFALRKAKTPWSGFGLSECNRVNMQSLTCKIHYIDISLLTMTQPILTD